MEGMTKRSAQLLAAALFLLPPFLRPGPLAKEGKEEAVFHGRLQFLATARDEFEEEEGEEHDRFSIRSARFGVKGEGPGDFGYELSWELRSHGEEGGAVEARDLRIVFEPRRSLEFHAGQFRVPFGRKRSIPSHRLLTIERPGVAGDFVPGRDIGIMARLRSPGGNYVFHGGVFTGAGPNRSRDDEKGEPLWAARVELAPLGMPGRTEGHHGKSRSPRIVIGAGWTSSDDGGPPEDDPEYLRTIAGRKRMAGVDGTLKFRGLFLSWEWCRAYFDPDGGPDFEAGGHVAQAAYFIRPLRLEPRIMFDRFDPSDFVEGDAEKTVTAGVNLILRGGRVKLMLERADHHRLDASDDRGWKEDETRLMLQVVILGRSGSK